MKRTFITLCLLSAFCTLPVNAQDFSKIGLKTTAVRGAVHMLEGTGGFAGGNIGVSAGEDGILIVDDQLKQMPDKINAALAKIDPGKLRFILNTHWHGDHTGGNAQLSKHATIISHANVRTRLMSEQTNSFRTSPAQPKEAWPLITFDQSLSLHFNGEEIQFIHYPNGHTDGDGVVFFTQSKVAHLGDHFFAGTFPYVDVDTGGNAFNLTKNIERIIERLPADTLVIPGHGGLSDMEDLKAYYKMLKTTTTHVQSLAAKGNSLEEIQLHGLPSEWKNWGDGFINETLWVEIIYKSLPKSSK
jgi:glyoxylase-like metal-dependent hydrolase (beta-lactamase superfamily II)